MLDFPRDSTLGLARVCESALALAGLSMISMTSESCVCMHMCMCLCMYNFYDVWVLCMHACVYVCVRMYKFSDV